MREERDVSAFSVNLNRLMLCSGISGKELSKVISVPEATISRWRSGVRLPHKSKIVLLADFFRVDPEAMTVPDGIEFLNFENGSEESIEANCRRLLDEILYRVSDDPIQLELLYNQLQDILQHLDQSIDR